jgi:hypothetical protein
MLTHLISKFDANAAAHKLTHDHEQWSFLWKGKNSITTTERS